jgi:pyruvate/2-oxoglutarate dehydrogenase complex dihydrolipoamide dehydrogenase (E3) component
MSRHFDAIVIGAGQAGPSLAGRLTGAGMTVALVERKLFGGTCVNTGCMPTKTLIAGAYAAHVARRGADYGVMLDAPLRIDMARVKARADAVSANARAGVEAWLRGMNGCTVIEGHARFVAPDTIGVGEERLSARRIFINVGGRAVVPDLPGIDRDPLSHQHLDAHRVPSHLIVIGGSYIGLEFAQMYRRFGAAVTVVEMRPRLVSREDEDVSQAIRDILEGEGIAVRTGAECIHFEPHAEGIVVGVECTSGDPEIVGTDVLPSLSISMAISPSGKRRLSSCCGTKI